MGRALPASIVTPTLVAQPVLTSIIAIPIVGGTFLLGQIVGGLLTILGIAMLNTSQKKFQEEIVEQG